MGLHEVLQTLPWAKASAGPPWPSKPKGFTTQTAFEHNSQVQAINLRAQTRSQLHKCHLTWMRQEDNCTAEPRLPRVMLPVVQHGPWCTWNTGVFTQHKELEAKHSSAGVSIAPAGHSPPYNPVSFKQAQIHCSVDFKRDWLSGFQVVYKRNLKGCDYSHRQLKHLLPFSSHPDPNLPMAEKYQMAQKKSFNWHGGEKKLGGCQAGHFRKPWGKSQPCRHPEKWEIPPLAWERCAPTEKVAGRNAPSLLDVWRINCILHTEHLGHPQIQNFCAKCYGGTRSAHASFALKDTLKINTNQLYSVGVTFRFCRQSKVLQIPEMQLATIKPLWEMRILVPPCINVHWEKPLDTAQTS